MRTLRRKLRRDIGRQRGQFVALVVTVLIGVAVFIASYDAFRNLEASYGRIFDTLAFADLTVSDGDVEAFAAEARDRPDVDVVEVRTTADAPFRVDGHKLRGRAVGMPGDVQPDVNRVEVLRGEYLSGDESALVDQHMADHFELGVGDRMDVHGPGGWRTVRIVGVAASPEYIWPARSRQDLIPSPDDFGVLYIPEATARTLASGSAPNDAVVTYADGTDRAVLDAELEELALAHGASRVVPRAEQASNAALKADLDGFREFSFLFPLLFLTAAGMATYVLLTRRVGAERSVIGTLRAAGYTRREVVRHYLGYGAITGAAGGIGGLVLGSLLAGLVTEVYTDVVSIPTTVIRIRPATLLVGLVTGLVAGGLGAAAPALSASRLSPAEAMRGVAPVRGGGPSIFERVLPPLRHLPVRARLVLRNIGRDTRRTAYTATGVVLAIVVVLVSWGLLDTMNVLIDRQVNKVLQQDARVRFTGLVGKDRLTELGATEGIATVEPSAEVPVWVEAQGERYETLAVALRRNTRMHTFFMAEGGTGELPSEGLLGGVALREELGVEVGDTVRVGIRGTDFTSTEEIRGFVDEPLGTFVYTSLEHARELAPVSGVPSALVTYTDGADPDTVRARVMAADDVAAFEDADAAARTMQEFLALFAAIVGMMLAFGAMLAFTLVFTMTVANIAERAGEVATLRANGMGLTRISRLLTAENVLVAVLGIPFGIVGGIYVAKGFLATYTNDLFRFGLELRPTTPVIIVAAVLVGTALFGWPALRAVARMDIAEVVRERAA